jgi:PPOX class probable F420-dependent enzyme
MENIPETHIDLLGDDRKAFLYLATLMPNGSPQVTPVWFNSDGEFILINTAKKRVKDRNMRVRSQVALCIQDPTNPYRYLQIHGNVKEFSTDGADAHIDALTLKYRGIPKYPSRQPGEQRVLYKIRIEKVDAHG